MPLCFLQSEMFLCKLSVFLLSKNMNSPFPLINEFIVGGSRKPDLRKNPKQNVSGSRGCSAGHLGWVSAGWDALFNYLLGQAYFHLPTDALAWGILYEGVCLCPLVIAFSFALKSWRVKKFNFLRVKNSSLSFIVFLSHIDKGVFYFPSWSSKGGKSMLLQFELLSERLKKIIQFSSDGFLVETKLWNIRFMACRSKSVLWFLRE